MATNLTPEEIRRASFKTVLRGLDASQVSVFLDQVASEMAAILEQNSRLQASMGEHAERDLESEFETLGREVTAVLQAAREAADSMRERASLDAARWRAESIAEAERVRKEAKNDAEALRGDAWATGSELLAQAVAEAQRLREQAERDVLTITGEAEREAHRLISAARRDSEDMSRSARMEAEKITADATKSRDDMIEQARRQSSAAEERTRALEERREELLEELENVRSTLTRLEGTLEERREDLHLSASDSATVRVVPTLPKDIEDWKPGETVRIIEPEGESGALMEPVEEETREAPTPTPDAKSPGESPPKRTSDRAPVAEPKPQPEDQPVLVPADVSAKPAPVSVPDDVGALFASLRGEKTTEKSPTQPETGIAETGSDAEEIVEEAEVAPEPPQAEVNGLIESRDGLLLPITNRALRGVKKAVTDAQNVALDNLRTDADWVAQDSVLAEALRADLIALWSESYTAGHDAAEEMTGVKLKRPVTPSSDAADALGSDLADAVNEALVSAGDGQRERQSATSRVFRSWRTDEAERRIRALSLEAFHRGLLDSAPEAEAKWVASGTPCSACTEAGENPRGNPPPTHSGCECTIVLT